MGKKAKLLAALVVLQLMISGCADHGKRFEVNGQIERIDEKKKILYVQGYEIAAEKPEEYHVGDHVRAVLRTPYKDKDVYIPDKTTTISIEKLSE